jgi:hypothetical protein
MKNYVCFVFFKDRAIDFINHGVFVGVVCMAFSKLFCFSVA